MLGELGAAAAFALIEGVQKMAAPALLAKPLTLAGPFELGHLNVHLHMRQEGNCTGVSWIALHNLRKMCQRGTCTRGAKPKSAHAVRCKT